MINGLDRANRLSDEIQKFVGENFNNKKEASFNPVLELLLYYWIMSKDTQDYSELFEKSSNEIQSFLKSNYISHFNPVKTWIKIAILEFLVNRKLKKTRASIKKTIIVLKDEKFYNYIYKLIQFHSKELIILTYDEQLKKKTHKDGFTSISIQQFIQPRYYRLINSKLKGANFAILEKVIIKNLFRSLKPKKVVLVEGNWHVDKITAMVCQKLKISTICVQHGWNPNLNCQWQNLIFDKMLTWGKYFSDELKKANQNIPITFQECGSHILEYNPKKKGELKAIGICIQCVNHIISEELYTSFFSDMIYISKELPHFSYIVREHPSHPLSEPEKDILSENGFDISNPYSESLTDFFDRIELSISIYSSTIIESIAAQVVPIIYNKTSLTKYTPDLDSLGLGHEVKQYEEVIKIIQKYEPPTVLEEKQDHIRKNLHHIFYLLGQKSCDRYESIIFSSL